ncbi:SDR family NAD(P)-dependent oxidoreductase [Phenylobacterium sp.]|uniref:SDR family NAD(P)-dependent oxidoreductase n=1 Tax=Phenylobacterium sp. TaxID=1871053 RepID=UPI0035B2F7C4
MKLTTGQRALVTGASRGLGVEIARALAGRGLEIVLAARSDDALAAVARNLTEVTGARVTTMVVDMSDLPAVTRLLDQVGPIDVLVNNAGVEGAQAYYNRDVDDIVATININLTAPMVLARQVLPGMISRGRGHIVNVASMAGLMAAAFNEPYSATKFGLVGFTRALRLTAKASGLDVSASAICPGFIDGAGMFENLKANYGIDAPGSAPIEDVGRAVLDAIEQDLPDVIVVRGDVRPYVAQGIIDPQAAEAAALASPGTALFQSVARARAGAAPTR